MTPSDVPSAAAISAAAAAAATSATTGPREAGRPERIAAALIMVAERIGSAVRDAAVAIGSRRGMPLAVAGIFILSLAWLGERDSAWGFPMLIAGAAMIGLGLLGPRLSGSLDLRWGDDGAFFQLTSTIAPPGQRHTAPRLESQSESPGPRPSGRFTPPSEIEGEAETIDFKITPGPDARTDAQPTSAGAGPSDQPS